MGLETRKGGGAYYYRKEWIGGRCRSVYVGSGSLALAYSFVDQEDRAAKRGDPDDAEAARLVDDVEAYCDEVTAVMREHLGAMGYHRHDRGAWRKKREPRTA